MMASSGPGRPAYPALPAAEHSFGILTDSIAGLMRNRQFAAADPLVTAEAVWAGIHGVTALLLDQARM